MAKEVTITAENVDDLDYVGKPGTRYEIAPGCIRVLSEPYNDICIEYDRLTKIDEGTEMNPDQEAHWVGIRTKAMELVTEGDDIPDRINMRVVNRVVADFFPFRMLTFGKRSS